MDYSAYTIMQSGYRHLPLEMKIAALERITGYRQLSVCEDVTAHYEY